MTEQSSASQRVKERKQILMSGLFLALLACIAAVLVWTIVGAYGTLHIVDESGAGVESMELTNGDSYLLVRLGVDSSEIGAVHLVDGDGAIEERRTDLTGASAVRFFIGGMAIENPWTVVVIDQSGEIVGEVRFEITRHDAWEDGIP